MFKASNANGQAYQVFGCFEPLLTNAAFVVLLLVVGDSHVTLQRG